MKSGPANDCGFVRRRKSVSPRAQRATAWYFLVIAGLFLLQGLLGAANAHYHVEPGGFYGLNLGDCCPTTCRACGTFSWRCSSSPRATWPWASSWPR